jgi:glutathione synthase/RimK-type ligase-like ATP-grasp enzyme
MSVSYGDNCPEFQGHGDLSRSEAHRPRIVVIATVHWAATTRLCLALADAGFDVAVLAPDDHALHAMSAIFAMRLGRTRAEALKAIAWMLGAFLPDLVIPADDRAIAYLGRVYWRALQGRGSNAYQLADIIERSVGTPSSFVFATQKSRFIELARAEGLRVPRTTPVRNIAELRDLLARTVFPVVIKQDETSGGAGVRVAGDGLEAERAFEELRAASSRRTAIKQALKRLDIAPLERFLRQAPTITLQQYIDGRPANRAVVCDRGSVRAGLSVEVLQTSAEAQPATVVSVIDSAEMAHASQRLVRRLGLSGFIGFDFMLEATSGRAFVLEMNARPTQICHIALDRSSDMVGALANSLSWSVPRHLPNVSASTIALFPQEFWRDPDSAHLKSACHDVPWTEPAFIAAYRHPVAPEPPAWTQRVRRSITAPARLFRHKAAAPAIGGPANLREGLGQPARSIEQPETV